MKKSDFIFLGHKISVPKYQPDTESLEYGPFAMWLVQAMQPQRIVELGSHSGYLYFAMCEAVLEGGLKTDCFGVSAWGKGKYANHQKNSIFDTVIATNKEFSHFSRLLQETSTDATSDIEDGSVDLLSICGRRNYDDVKGDFESWIPKLSSSSIVLFHCTGTHEDRLGICRYWAELENERPSFSFKGGNGLGVLFWGDKVSNGLIDLLDLTTVPDRIETALTLFSTIGSRANTKIVNRALGSRLLAHGHGEIETETRVPSVVLRVSEYGGSTESHETKKSTLSNGLEETSLQLEALQQQRESREFELNYVLTKVNSPGWLLKRSLKLMKYLPRDLGRKLRGKKEYRKPATLAELGLQAPPNGSYKKLSLPSLLNSSKFGQLPARSQLDQLLPSVLIVAELAIPQCTKYRVTQKAEALESLGFDVSIMPWQDSDKVLNALQTHTLVIFYRVPGIPEVLEQFKEAKRLGIPVGYDIDDLIFDVDKYGSNPNLGALGETDLENLMAGAELYRRALMHADFNVGSTEGLCTNMTATNGAPSFILENALDAETLSVTRSILEKKNSDSVTIVYGSGTNTHNADFEVASDAILKIMREYDNVRLHIVGQLVLPPDFEIYDSRIKYTGRLEYSEYLSLLAEDDISIAPLVDIEFNHAKSNIKFLEAASVGLPSVCSDVSAFRTAIEHGQTGFLAATKQEWYEGLKLLVEDSELRKRIGATARAAVETQYSPNAIRDRQLMPIVKKYIARPTFDRTRVMMANVFYAPQSFGGATLLVENLVASLTKNHEFDISVFATGPGHAADRVFVRRQADGNTVFRFGCQSDAMWADQTPKEALECFRKALRATRPDVVHFHSIQGFGNDFIAACDEFGIPYCITLHDAWWLCARQFLVTKEGKYCGQTKVNREICQKCVGTDTDVEERHQKLTPTLQRARRLLTPSKYWAKFHIDNGLPEETVIHCENGIEIPASCPPNSAKSKVRFGFVAGTEVVKGFPVMRDAFNSLTRRDWSLTLVDHTRKISDFSLNASSTGINGDVRIAPPFDAKSRDSFFDKVDVLLFPSQWPESFGLTVREALVRNKWVIATDLGGQAEAITSGENGTLIPLEGGAASLAEAIEEILDQKSMLSGWVNPNRNTIRSVDDQATELAELYKEFKVDYSTAASRMP